jgi:hypothetical protein
MRKSDKELINEMSLGMGGVAEGGGSIFGEHDDDDGDIDDMDLSSMRDVGDDPDHGEDFDDLDMGGDEDEDQVSVSRSELRSLLDEVSSGELSAEEAFQQCCGEGVESPMDPMGPEDDDTGMGDMDFGGDDDDTGMGDMDDNPFAEAGGSCGMGSSRDMGRGRGGGMWESIDRIASMLTEDPDILDEASEKKPCPECPKDKKAMISPSAKMCRKCDQKLQTPPSPRGGPKKAKKKLEDPDNPHYND